MGVFQPCGDRRLLALNSGLQAGASLENGAFGGGDVHGFTGLGVPSPVQCACPHREAAKSLHLDGVAGGQRLLNGVQRSIDDVLYVFFGHVGSHSHDGNKLILVHLKKTAPPHSRAFRPELGGVS